jgi:hypothetical protein
MPNASKILFFYDEEIRRGEDMTAFNTVQGFLRSFKTSNLSDLYNNNMIESHIHFIITEEKKTAKHT